MKAKFPIIGPVRTGKDAKTRTVTKTVDKVVEKLVTSQLGSGFLDLWDKSSLTNYTKISERLIKSFYGWTYVNVSTLAEAVSQIEFELYQVKVVKGEVEFVEVVQHEILDLLDRFNPFTTTSEAMYLVEAYLELTGDNMLLLDNAAKPKSLFLLDPTKVDVHPGDVNDNYQVRGYTYKDKVDGEQTEVTYKPDRIIHIKNPNPGNPYRGKSTVEAASDSIDTSNLMAEFFKVFFQNGAVINFALSSDQRISPEDIQRIEATLKRKHGGVKNAFKALLLGGGLKPVPIQQTGREMQMLELENAMRDKIMAHFKNTKASLGITDDVNRANAEATLIQWKKEVIKPKMRRITDSLNEFLVPKFGTNLILTFKDPVPEDRAVKITEAKDLKGADIISLNEARAMLGQDPVEGGDEFSFQRSERQQAAQAFVAPKNLKNISLERHMRRMGLYGYIDVQKNIYTIAVRKARNIIKARKEGAPKKEAELARYHSFTNDAADHYWAKQIQIAEVVEQRFAQKVDSFLEKLQETAIKNLPKSTKAVKAFELFDETAEVNAAIDLLTPLLEEISELSGSEAYQAFGLATLYNPSPSLKAYIRASVEKFTKSFITTDREKLTEILNSGIEQGNSIPQIEQSIRTEFTQFRKIQSERIAKSETLRASNHGALDAFKESGVVQAKQWYTSHDARVCPICAPLDGKMLGLNSKFPFEDDYDTKQHPPAHVSCRCVLLPVLTDAKGQKAEHEKLVAEHDQLKAYTRELEEIVGVKDESEIQK
jgi:HK97 family phage portal protein